MDRRPDAHGCIQRIMFLKEYSDEYHSRSRAVGGLDCDLDDSVER
jgi:hypothetical protein